MCRSDIVNIIIIRPDLSQIYVSLLSPLSGDLRGVSKKGLLTECRWSHGSSAQSAVAGTPCYSISPRFGPEIVSLGRFFLRLSRIKHPQVMSMVKFSSTALNFGYDFVL